jgi:hypothetical protein
MAWTRTVAPPTSPCSHCRAGLATRQNEGIVYHPDVELPSLCIANAHTLNVILRIDNILHGKERRKNEQ